MKLKAVYTVGELAQLAGLTKRSLKNKLEQEGVPLKKTKKKGYAQLVTLAELMRAWPELWESLLQMDRLRKAQGSGRRPAES